MPAEGTSKLTLTESRESGRQLEGGQLGETKGPAESPLESTRRSGSAKSLPKSVTNDPGATGLWKLAAFTTPPEASCGGFMTKALSVKAMPAARAVMEGAPVC